MVNQKKRLFNLLAILAVTVAMVASPILSQFVMADDDITNATTGTINIESLNNGTEGDVYRVIIPNWDDTSKQPKAPQYKWDGDVSKEKSVAKWVKDNYPQYIDKSGFVTDSFKDTLGDSGKVTNRVPENNGAAEFYDKLANAIKKGSVTVSETKAIQPATGEDGKATASVSGLKMGSYLILFKNDMRVYRPSVVNLIPKEKDGKWVLEPVKVVVKSTEVPIEKTAKDVQVAIGENVEFTITSTLPVYPANAESKVYNIYDNLPMFLKLNDDSVKVFGVKDGEAIELSTDAYKKVTTDGKDAVSLGIEFDYDKVIKDYDGVKITYSALLLKESEPGTAIVNKAKVKYNNDPYSSTAFKEKPSDVKVFTYGIDLNKVDGDKALSGAKFKLYKKDSPETAIKVIKEADGRYRLPEKNDEGSQVDEMAVTVDEMRPGNLQIKGLDVGEYLLEETVAPSGYVKLQSKQSIVIKDDNKDGKVDENPLPNNNGYVTTKIENSKGFTLPITGGKGLVMFEIIGTLAIAAGLFGIIASRRKSREEQGK